MSNEKIDVYDADDLIEKLRISGFAEAMIDDKKENPEVSLIADATIRLSELKKIVEILERVEE